MQKIERTKLELRSNLRGNLISRLRYTLELPDNCLVPEFVFEVGMDELNEILEKHFFDKMLIVIEK